MDNSYTTLRGSNRIEYTNKHLKTSPVGGAGPLSLKNFVSAKKAKIS